MMGYFAVFIAFSAFPGFSNLFWDQVYELTWLIRVPADAVFVGWYYTQIR